MKILPSLTLLKKNWQMVLILIMATLLRTWEIDTKAIFFGDAAHDLLVAAQAVETKQLPLLGIASSVPRFKQGPLTVWLEMMIYAVAGYRLIWFSLIFAVISLAAIIAVYEYAALYLGKKLGILASLLIATSPLAVAHGRVVYHITPIPLIMVLFWFSLVKLWNSGKWSIFWAVLAWCGLFQFELALLPLILMIPYIVFRTRQRLSHRMVGEAAAALGLGLLPQIIFDLTHKFAQLGGFAVWVVYRIVSAMGLIGQHAMGPSRLLQAFTAFWLYLGRVVSTDNSLFKVFFLTVIVFGFWKGVQALRRQTLPPAMEIVFGSTVVLLLGFLIHSSPSEAYFPPFIVCLPMIVAYAWSQLKPSWRLGGAVLLTVVCLMTTLQILQHNFFVSTNRTFSYGAGVGEQRQVVSFSSLVSGGSFTFATTQDAGKFPSFFDNLRWVAAEQGLQENPDGEVIYVETRDSVLNSYPGMKKASFPTVDLYQIPSL